MGRDKQRGNVSHHDADFNPLSPHGERPRRAGKRSDDHAISIHSPRMGRDRAVVPRAVPAGGISIHSPRMGRDGSVHPSEASHSYFNPLSPHGERHVFAGFTIYNQLFQSTLPAWGETANAHNFSKRKTGASAQHCIFSPAKRFFLLTKNFLEKRNKPFFRCEPYRKTVGAPVSHQPLKN